MVGMSQLRSTDDMLPAAQMAMTGSTTLIPPIPDVMASGNIMTTKGDTKLDPSSSVTVSGKVAEARTVPILKSQGMELVRDLGALSEGDRQLRAAALTVTSGGEATGTFVGREKHNEEIILQIAMIKSSSMVGTNRRIKTVELGMAAIGLAIPGDFVETGTYQGGTAVLMCRTLLSFSAPGTRDWWGADSFDGLPDYTEKDKHSYLSADKEAGVRYVIRGKRGKFRATEQQLVDNLRNHGVYEMPGAQVHILKGWFNETLPDASIKAISFLRLDGDMYVSTVDGLRYLYPRLSVGGFVYIDDYGSFTGCRNAVEEYRTLKQITSPMYVIPEDGTDKFEGVWWQKSAATG
eukprot:TRINITY_DN27900_c0_g1_i6.p1 TRINITY_DN27900_c0_g1~~TRINITY_DN27900_c0_g1_i6.p1  ORF type:complete len:349 (-),score=32.06 TRINITY_DN27900_c0_g1_i6:273-1319(-)